MGKLNNGKKLSFYFRIFLWRIYTMVDLYTLNSTLAISRVCYFEKQTIFVPDSNNGSFPSGVVSFDLTSLANQSRGWICSNYLLVFRWLYNWRHLLVHFQQPMWKMPSPCPWRITSSNCCIPWALRLATIRWSIWRILPTLTSTTKYWIHLAPMMSET